MSHTVENETRIQNFSLIEVGELIPLYVSIEDEYLFKNIYGLNEVFQKIFVLSPRITALGESAFIYHDKTAWNEIQSLLYYWNYRDLMRIDRVKDHVSLIEYALRNILLNIQFKNAPIEPLECFNAFTPEKAVEELSDKVLSHRINRHPLLEKMEKEGLPLEGLKFFLENYHVGHSVFHLCLAALNFSVPIERRTELANNLYEEMGSGNPSLAHPLLFLKNFNVFKQMPIIFPMPESLFFANAKIYATFLSGDYHYGMGGLGAIELSIPHQMKKILEGLKKSGLSHNDLEFWELHIMTDEKHGKIWFAEMVSMIKAPEQAQACLTGGIHLLNARACMYDGIQRNL